MPSLLCVTLLLTWALVASITSVQSYRSGRAWQARAQQQQAATQHLADRAVLAERDAAAVRRQLTDTREELAVAREVLSSAEADVVQLEERLTTLAGEKAALEDFEAFRAGPLMVDVPPVLGPGSVTCD